MTSQEEIDLIKYGYEGKQEEFSDMDEQATLQSFIALIRNEIDRHFMTILGPWKGKDNALKQAYRLCPPDGCVSIIPIGTIKEESNE